MLGSRPATILTTIGVIAAATLFLWIVVTAATDSETPPQGGPGRGATPEPPTPTLESPHHGTLDATKARIRQDGAGTVLDRALAGDVNGLLDLVEWEQKPCDDPEVVWHRCAEASVAPGTPVQVTQLEIGREYYDRTYVAAFLASLLDGNAELVFAGRTTDRVGMSFAIPSAKARPIGGGSPLRGIWFDVRPGTSPVIQKIYFFTEFSGPRQFFQAFYQPRGGELWYFDQLKSPGAAPVATPGAPPPSP